MTPIIELRLDHDDKKELKEGKRRYKDDNGHNVYLTGDEVQALGEPAAIVLSVSSA